MQFLKRLIYGKRYARVSNDAERIETLRFVVPALRVGVLEYAPGQLQTGAPELQNKTVKLYYPPEALQDKKFLKSLEDAPIVLGGHDKTTNEKDKEIDGWARSVRYDESQQAAIVDGTVKGKDGAKYIRDNFKGEGFGASAFIDVYGLKVEEGTTPDGYDYNAVATKLRAVHLALAPSVRDPENQIELVNAVTINSRGTMNKKTEGKMEMDERALAAIVANTVKEVLAKNAEGEELKDMKKTLSEVIDAVDTLKKAISSETKERAEDGEAKNEKEDEEKEVKNKEESEKGKEKEKEKEEGEGATLENAIPSQKIVSAFASAFNIEFGRKTPSFKTLASLAGIKTDDPSERIALVNTKFSEISGATASNTSTGTAHSVFGVIGGEE